MSDVLPVFSWIPGPLIAVLVVLLTVCYFCRSPSNRPPGPIGIPLLGYLPFLDPRRPYITMDKLCKIYGPVTSFYIGPTQAVVLGDYHTIRKALQDSGDVFSGRPPNYVDRLPSVFQKCIGFSSGSLWSEQRRFAISVFRNISSGSAHLESRLLNEMQYFLDVIFATNGKPFNITELLFMSSSNNICILVLGKRFEYTNPKFKHFLHVVHDQVKEFDKPTPDMLFPWIRKLPGSGIITRKEKISRISTEVYNELKRLISDHMMTHTPGSKSSFIEAFLTERDSRQTEEAKEFFNDEILAANLWILFLGGSDTISIYLLWALLFMMLHPDIQRKVQQEIDDVIGSERMPSLEDRHRMPYTEATMTEIHRRSTMGAYAFPHSATKDVIFEGYHISKGAYIFPNVWAVHNDSHLYPDPQSFRPERFINQDGKAIKPEHLFPFGVGKRVCIGEQFSRQELFLYFTSMLQKFTFVKPEAAVITTRPRGNIISSPPPYQLIALPRAS